MSRPHEKSPLLHGIDPEDCEGCIEGDYIFGKTLVFRRRLLLSAGALALGLFSAAAARFFGAGRRAPAGGSTAAVTTIDAADERDLDIGGGLSLWCRTWGNRASGVPVLFVHGGPGNAIEDYGRMNAEFFDAARFFVVEVDQRGTGRSKPSVREDYRNMKYYADISIGQMSADFETVRESLDIDKWLVFGGSWGSTLGLDYSVRFPERCLGLIIRGVFLQTPPEISSVFARKPYVGHKRRMSEFNGLYDLAANEAEDSGEPELDPNDSERLLRLYERMIVRGDREAIWRWWVFEENLMEEDPANLYDQNVIVEEKLPEARSVAFFETRLFLYGTYDAPVNFFGRVDSLRSGGPVHTWICQGLSDNVCPDKFARKLVDALELADVPNTPRFVDAGHLADSDVMSHCLESSIDEFLSSLMSNDSS